MSSSRKQTKMHKNLIEILGRFTPKDMKAFKKYMNRFHQGEEQENRLLGHISNPRLCPNLLELEPEKIHRKIFKGIDYKKVNFQNIQSNLFKYLKEFLIWQELQAATFMQENLLLTAYKRYQLDRSFFHQANKIEKILKDNKEIVSDALYQKSQIANKVYQHLPTERMKAYDKLNEGLINLDFFYATKKMQYACEVWNRHLVLQDALPDIALIEEIEKIPEVNNQLLFHVYKRIYDAFQNIEQLNFGELKLICLKQMPSMNEKDRFTVIVYLLNILALQPKYGKTIQLEQTFDLYEKGIDEKAFIIDGYFDNNIFMNIVDAACKLEKTEWARDFLLGWIDMLPGYVKESAEIISTALILFEEKKFESVLNLIDPVKKVNTFFKIRYYLLLISSSFELGKEITTQCKAFTSLIRRDKFINETNKKRVSNYIFLVQKLDDPNIPKDKLLKEFHKRQNVHFRRWLESKINSKKN